MASAEEHNHWEELAVGYALSSLSPEDSETFSRHLPTCDACAATVAETRDTMADLAHAVPDAQPPPSLRQAILSRAAETPGRGRARAGGHADTPDDRTDEVSARRERSGRAVRARGALWVPWYGAAAVLVLILALAGANAFLLFDPRDQEQEQNRQWAWARALADCVESANCRTVPLRATDGSAVPVLALVHEGRIRLIIDGLKTNNAQQSMYVLWQKSRSGLHAVNEFDVTRSAVFMLEAGHLAGPLGRTAFLAVSRERGPTVPAKPSTPIAVGKVATGKDSNAQASAKGGSRASDGVE